MNVFACDPSPHASARALADRHVVKMVLETAQILSTTAHVLGLDTEQLYRPTHQHHPVVASCVRDPGYRRWVIDHGHALAREYTHRFGRIHVSAVVLDRAASRLRPLPSTAPAHVPLAMPAEHRGDDPYESYRRYLCAKYAAWGSNARWTGRPPPTWAPPNAIFIPWKDTDEL